MSRHEFSEPDKRLLAERVGYHCSNPSCGVSTIGPSMNPEEKEYVGVAAHIYSASIKSGPRANPAMTEEERKSITNGIHLCNKCSTLIDKNDGRGYPPEILYQWKRNAESIARRRIYQDGAVNLYQLVEFDNLERQYSTALTCSGLGEKNVLSCPSHQPYIQDISTKLNLASKCIIRGDSGCGKSLLTYQVAKEFCDNGWRIYKLNKRTLMEGVGIAAPSKKSVIIIDDSQTIDAAQLENIIESSNEDCNILLNWNYSTSNNGDFLRSYPYIDIVSSQQVEMLKEYCIKNKNHIAKLLEGMGVKLSDRNHFEMIETRIQRASREKTPWLFNYSLTEGWRVAENDIELLKDRGRLDLVMVIVAAYQYATLDQGVSEEVITAELREYCLDQAWLNKAIEVLKEYCVSNDDLVRHKHYQYAKEVMVRFIANEKVNSCQEYAIALFKRILTDRTFEKGHSNVLEFIFFDYKYCHYVLKKDGFITKITEDLFSRSVSSVPIKTQKLNSLIRFDKSVTSIIDDHINVVSDWVVKCDRDSAYPLRHLLNTLINEKYKNFVVTDEIIESVFAKLLESHLADKARYSSLIDRLTFFFNETQKEKSKNIIADSGLAIDISKYPIGEAHYLFSEIITNLSYINEEWANTCVLANIESIAENLNKDLLRSYELYRTLIDHYFQIVHWILDTKTRKSIKNSTAKKLAKLVEIDAVLASFDTLELSRVQEFYTFLIFLEIYNKKVLGKISERLDYDHLKHIYRNDFKLEHNHECLMQCLYNPESQPYKDYVDYVIGKNEEIVELLIALNPDKSIDEMKKGKVFKMIIHSGSEYKFVLTLLNSLDTEDENDLSQKIIRDNKDEIKKSIFNKAINVDNKKEKYSFLVYLFRKSPDIIRDIFSCQEEVDELFIKLQRLLKGKAIEKNIARLYAFFIKEFTKSHTAQINALEARFLSVRKYSI